MEVELKFFSKIDEVVGIEKILYNKNFLLYIINVFDSYGFMR